MTKQRSRAGSRLSPYAATTLALVSPLICGVVWLIATGIWWQGGTSTSAPDLATFVAFWALMVYGLIALALLAIPLTIGLVSRSLVTRLAAAWVEAAMCALAAVIFGLTSLPHQYYDGPGLPGYLAIGLLLVPAALTAVAFRVVGPATEVLTTR